MSTPPEHRDHLVEALAPTTKPGPGCGCIGWAVFAVFFLVLGGNAIGVWRPLIVLPVVFIVVGAVFWTLFSLLRGARWRRARYDPRNADWHPASLGRDARREPAPEMRAAAPEDTPPPAAVPPAGAPASAPSEAPAAASHVDATPADLPGAPQAPEAPEAPASPWT